MTQNQNNHELQTKDLILDFDIWSYRLGFNNGKAKQLTVAATKRQYIILFSCEAEYSS